MTSPLIVAAMPQFFTHGLRFAGHLAPVFWTVLCPASPVSRPVAAPPVRGSSRLCPSDLLPQGCGEVILSRRRTPQAQARTARSLASKPPTRSPARTLFTQAGSEISARPTAIRSNSSRSIRSTN